MLVLLLLCIVKISEKENVFAINLQQKRRIISEKEILNLEVRKMF